MNLQRIIFLLLLRSTPLRIWYELMLLKRWCTQYTQCTHPADKTREDDHGEIKTLSLQSIHSVHFGTMNPGWLGRPMEPIRSWDSRWPWQWRLLSARAKAGSTLHPTHSTNDEEFHTNWHNCSRCRWLCWEENCGFCSCCEIQSPSKHNQKVGEKSRQDSSKQRAGNNT